MTPLMLLVAGALLVLSIVAPQAAEALVLPTLGLLVVYLLLPARARGDAPAGSPRRRRGDRLGWLDALVAFAALSVCVAGPLVYVDLAGQIQDERVRSVRDNCVQVNERNRDTKAEIDAAVKALPAGRRARAQAGRDSTFAIIDALAPVRDCELVVRKQVPSAFD